MKIRLVSDLHYEFMPDRGKAFTAGIPNDCDVLVIAGDLCPLHDGLIQALEGFAARFREVVYVCGNHDYFGASKFDVDHVRASMIARLPNLHWLDKDVWVYGDRRFLGCTLWYKHQPYGLIRNMCDPWQIKDLEKWVYKENAESVAFLNQECKAGDIVVTHHLPSYRSVAPRFVGNSLNPFFVHPMDDMIESGRPALWMHGHTHESCDYHLDTTRIVCNPHGYWPEDVNLRYKNDLMIILDDKDDGSNHESDDQEGSGT